MLMAVLQLFPVCTTHQRWRSISIGQICLQTPMPSDDPSAVDNVPLKNLLQMHWRIACIPRFLDIDVHSDKYCTYRSVQSYTDELP